MDHSSRLHSITVGKSHDIIQRDMNVCMLTWLHFITVGKSQEPEILGHMISYRTRVVCMFTHSCSALLLHSQFRIPRLGIGAAHTGLGFPHQLAALTQFPIDTPTGPLSVQCRQFLIEAVSPVGSRLYHVASADVNPLDMKDKLFGGPSRRSTLLLV